MEKIWKIYITFSVPIKKECDNGKKIACKLRFIDSFRFMSTTLSELVDNMSGVFNGIECQWCIENNRCKQCKKLIEGLIKMFPCVFKWIYFVATKRCLSLWIYG